MCGCERELVLLEIYNRQTYHILGGKHLWYLALRVLVLMATKKVRKEVPIEHFEKVKTLVSPPPWSVGRQDRQGQRVHHAVRHWGLWLLLLRRRQRGIKGEARGSRQRQLKAYQQDLRVAMMFLQVLCQVVRIFIASFTVQHLHLLQSFGQISLQYCSMLTQKIHPHP